MEKRNKYKRKYKDLTGEDIAMLKEKNPVKRNRKRNICDTNYDGA